MFYLLTSGSFSFSISILYLDLSIILSLSRKLKVLGPPCRGCSCGQDRHCLPFQIEKSGFAKVSLARRFGAKDGIVHKVLVVWVLPILCD